jgi:mannosyltransferase
MIEDGVDGFLFEPGDVEGLRGVLERVMARPELAREVGRRAVERVRRQFTAQQEAQRLLEVYRCENSPPLGQPGLQCGNNLGSAGYRS